MYVHRAPSSPPQNNLSTNKLLHNKNACYIPLITRAYTHDYKRHLRFPPCPPNDPVRILLVQDEKKIRDTSPNFQSYKRFPWRLQTNHRSRSFFSGRIPETSTHSVAYINQRKTFVSRKILRIFQSQGRAGGYSLHTVTDHSIVICSKQHVRMLFIKEQRHTKPKPSSTYPKAWGC